MTAYYNENDEFAAEWLRMLIREGEIAPGHVDERSILDVRPSDLRGFTQCHFFAGIGVWSAAARDAGWPDDRPIWTGSCPCQPYSAAGKGLGFADERHLWPAWFHLIRELRPTVIFGEQVATKSALAWVDLIQSDLEAAHYASGSVIIPAAGVGAPHKREREWFVAENLDHKRGSAAFRLDHNNNKGLEGQRRGLEAEGGRDRALRPVGQTGEFGGMADSISGQLSQSQRGSQRRDGNAANCGLVEGRTFDLADTYGRNSGTEWQQCSGQFGQFALDSESGRSHRIARSDHDFWRDADWLKCRDDKWRPVEPGTLPLAHGTPARMGLLRGYGNAVNKVAATQIIKAYRQKDIIEFESTANYREFDFSDLS